MKKKVLVGLSGGVDSAVSALLLQKDGWDVTGGFMINYKDVQNPNCTTRLDIKAAKEVADFLGIKLLKFDFVKEYEERILNYIFEGYQKGITPNPDVFCNNLVKFDLFLNEAMKLGFDKIAMGHYAKIKKSNRGQVASGKGLKDLPPSTFHLQPATCDLTPVTFNLFQGKDRNKDQSYFLSGLNEYQLSKSIFPLGKLTKQEVRKIAEENKLPNAKRPDSQGLCFVGKVSMKDFLATKIPPKKGKILTTMGEEVGDHDGAWTWTIGQKRGLNINKPAYVVGTDVEKNTVIVSYDKKDPLLFTKEVVCKNRHWIGKIMNNEKGIMNNGQINQKKSSKSKKNNNCRESGLPIPKKTSNLPVFRTDKPDDIIQKEHGSQEKDFFCKLRYRQKKQTCNFEYDKKENTMKIILDESAWGIPKGQIAVLYHGEQVLGNGVIF